jgi:hypothetical protein
MNRKAQIDLTRQHLNAGLDPSDLIYLKPDPQPQYSAMKP